MIALTIGGVAGGIPVAASASNGNTTAAVLNDDQDDLAVNAANVGVTFCNGGVQESALVTMSDVPTNLVENAAFAPLPGASIVFVTPVNDSDQILVTFSAEARLMGQPVTYLVPTDFLQVRILLDGVPMMPDNDLTFTTDTGHANATETCKRLPAVGMVVAHTVTVQWLLVDQAAASVLTGTLDDWTLHVEINN